MHSSDSWAATCGPSPAFPVCCWKCDFSALSAVCTSALLPLLTLTSHSGCLPDSSYQSCFSSRFSFRIQIFPWFQVARLGCLHLSRESRHWMAEGQGSGPGRVWKDPNTQIGHGSKSLALQLPGAGHCAKQPCPAAQRNSNSIHFSLVFGEPIPSPTKR